MSDAPKLSEVLERSFEKAFRELHTWTVGEIVSYNSDEGSATIQPLIKRSYMRDGVKVPELLPACQRVPVMFPGAGAVRIKFPIAAGDVVVLLFCEQSIDRWKVRGGQVDPGDERRFSMSDAIAIPGLADFTRFADGDPMIEITSTEIRAGGTQPLVTKAEFMAHTHTAPGGGGVTTTPAVTIDGTAKLRG